MSMKLLAAGVMAILGTSAGMATQAAALNYGDQLTIVGPDLTDNVIFPMGGSYFAMDTNGNSKISGSEKIPLYMGIYGIIIGQTTAPGASHPGLPTVGDTNIITAPWNFFGNTGSDYLTVPITGNTTSGLDMSGWTVTWNGIAAIPMGTGAWQTATGTGHAGAAGTFVNGVGNFTWSGIYGAAYTLDYRATVPLNDPSGFGGVQYELHLEGTVGPIGEGDGFVPVPAAAWLLGSGLMGLIGVARRKSV